jgi:hypothetical protein
MVEQYNFFQCFTVSIGGWVGEVWSSGHGGGGEGMLQVHLVILKY